MTQTVNLSTLLRASRNLPCTGQPPAADVRLRSSTRTKRSWTVDANFEVVFWPVAMDAKYKDVEAMEDGSILVTLFNGGIRNDENEHIAKLLRQKSKILVSFGSCACEGCIPGLANLSPVGEIVHTAFNTITTDNPNEIYPRTTFDVPEGELHIPKLERILRPLDQVVDVDYYMPGCPPESHQIAEVIDRWSK